ncbi:MAG TPA: light-harvesting protein [Gemmatimonas sp.]|nr:light-harvesting protein [Gemmatimonas sp.]
MHKIWQGTDPMVNLAGLGVFLACLALIIHAWAYSITGWPASERAQNQQQTPSAQVR